MHPSQKVVSIAIPVNDEKKMESFQEMMNEWQDAQNKYILALSSELHISIECAMDVSYLRTRSRWSEANEKELIRLHSIGEPPKICEWP